MSRSARELGCSVLIAPLCHWVYFSKSVWYWKNLFTRALPNVLRLRRIISGSDIKLVYSNTAAIFEPALAARWAGVPHLWHVHEVLKVGNSMDQLLPMGLLKRLIYRWSDALVFESHCSRTVFEESTPSDKSHVVYNSVRLGTGRTDDGEAGRAAYDLCPGDRVVGFIGQMIDRKNPLLLVRAIGRLRDVPGLKCLFVGDGPLREAVGALIRTLGLGDCCRVIDFQRDVGRVLSCLDVLVLPSRQESFGLVLVEAGAYGKPVIACTAEGPSEIIVPGETGFLVGQDDERALADAIALVLSPAVDRPRVGAAAARRAGELFCPIKNTRRLEAIMHHLLGTDGNTACASLGHG
jgi:glycosyltransferase involved in cell wall biosynthesis